MSLVWAVTVVALATGGAVGVRVLLAERRQIPLQDRRIATPWAAAVVLLAGGLLSLALQGDGTTAFVMAAVGIAVTGVPAGAWAAASSAVETIGAARTFEEAVRRSAAATDRLHTRFENTLDDDGADEGPEMVGVRRALATAYDTIRPSRDEVPGFIKRRWRQKSQTVERYYNLLDVPRTWHDERIERLTLLVTFELRLLLVGAGPLLGASASFGDVPDLSEINVEDVVWMAYAALALATAAIAPAVAARMMEPSASRRRAQLGAVELGLGLLLCVILPSWLIAAAVLSSILNLWNREGGFSWRYKVPAGCGAVAGALEVGLLLDGSAGIGLLVEPALAGATLALISSSYGVWWPFSGAVLLLTPVARRRGRAAAERVIGTALARVEQAIAEAEATLSVQADAGDERAYEQRCRLRRATREYGKTAVLPEQVEDLARAVLPRPAGLAGLSEVTLDVDPVIGDRRFRSIAERMCFAGAVELLGREAVRHGTGTLTVEITAVTGRVTICASNLIRHDRRAGRGLGRERLKALAAGLDGQALPSKRSHNRFSIGLEFPEGVLR